jgi:hypothetical protein
LSQKEPLEPLETQEIQGTLELREMLELHLQEPQSLETRFLMPTRQYITQLIQQETRFPMPILLRAVTTQMLLVMR